MGVHSVLIEGGLDTWSRFLSEKMVDKARICVSDIDLGGDGPTFDTKSLSESGLILASEEEVCGDSLESESNDTFGDYTQCSRLYMNGFAVWYNVQRK